ncbi:tyrosine protein kinase [Entamoeba marina]
MLNYLKKKDSLNHTFYSNIKKNLKIPCEPTNVVLNKSVLRFSQPNSKSGQIPVMKPSIEKVIIANPTKKTRMISFRKEKSSLSRFDMKVTPSTIKLKSKEACEFEIQITPLCTCNIFEDIYVVSSVCNKETILPIHLDLSTPNSPYFDFEDIDEYEFLYTNEYRDYVWRGYYKGKQVLIDNRSNQNPDKFEKEVNILKGMKSPYILYFNGACHLQHHQSIITECPEFGLLSTVMKYVQPNDFLKLKLCLNISKGVDFLHKNGVLHRDIRPENISVVSLDDSFEVNAKITGFSKAKPFNRLKNKSQEYTEDFGTTKYMPPESISYNFYSTASDIFSLAITMYQIYTWGKPWTSQYSSNIEESIVQGIRPLKTDYMDPKFYQLLESCWKQDPTDRANLSYVIKSLTSMLNELK